jgi:site-specific DNA-methyltransferase (adenine-specific)
MNRKRAFQNGLRPILQPVQRMPLVRSRGPIGTIRPSLYNAGGMVEPNQILQGDSIQILNDGKGEWADLVFADPPFNIGYLYHGYNDRQNTKDYLKFSEEWIRAVYHALKPTGSFYLAIGDEYAADLCVIARRNVGFNLRNWIIWHYTFGQQTKMKFAKSHTHILYFTKDPGVFTFNADAVRVASARQTTYADARANPKGKLPDDTWYLRPQEAAGHAYVEAGFKKTMKDAAKDKSFAGADSEIRRDYFDPTSDTWNVSRVCGTFHEREGFHGCQMPLGVLDRIVKASSNPGDIVLDPFNGSGTTAVSAAMLGRKYVGIDQSAEYVKFARTRVENALAAAEAAKSNGKSSEHAIAAVVDPKRTSKVKTGTDAFGRPRVARGSRRRAEAKSA